jgi:hypothetical protein
MPRKVEDSPRFLAGWKDIANYLGKGVRTVQRYEREIGLPIRRPAGKSRGSVIATKAELDAWVAVSPIREMFHLPRPLPDNSPSAFTKMKTGIAEMQRLRNKMAELRDELIDTVRVLQDSISGVQLGISSVEAKAPLPIADGNLRRKTADLGKPRIVGKAS